MSNLKYYSILVLIFLGVLALSFSTLITKPRLWIDEAKSIELARGFLKFGKLDIETAPREFTGFPELLQSTGYPVTVPLAVFFKLFGYGLAQARIYMLIWMVVALSTAFIVARRLFGDWPALGAVLLIATFASFHDSGRTVVGEIPGFVFLLAGIYFWLIRGEYFGTGLWWGLTVVVKPSVYTWIIPTIFLVFLLEKKDFLKRVSAVAIGMLPAAFGWILLVLDEPFSKLAWVSIGSFYKNPYGVIGATEQIFNNLINAPYSTTLIYFGFWFVVLFLGRYRLEDWKLKSLYNFALIYSFFAFAYYLRSPGWLRYILVAELLILFLLPQALVVITKRRRLMASLVMLLALIQLFHFFTGADIYYSDAAIRASDFLNEQFPDKSIGVLDSLNLAALIKSRQRFLVAEMAGLPQLGINPLLRKPLPEVIASDPDNKFFQEELEVIRNNYDLVKELNGYNIYSLKLINI